MEERYVVEERRLEYGLGPDILASFRHILVLSELHACRLIMNSEQPEERLIALLDLALVVAGGQGMSRDQFERYLDCVGSGDVASLRVLKTFFGPDMTERSLNAQLVDTLRTSASVDQAVDAFVPVLRDALWQRLHAYLTPGEVQQLLEKRKPAFRTFLSSQHDMLRHMDVRMLIVGAADFDTLQQSVRAAMRCRDPGSPRPYLDVIPSTRQHAGDVVQSLLESIAFIIGVTVELQDMSWMDVGINAEYGRADPPPLPPDEEPAISAVRVAHGGRAGEEVEVDDKNEGDEEEDLLANYHHADMNGGDHDAFYGSHMEQEYERMDDGGGASRSAILSRQVSDLSLDANKRKRPVTEIVVLDSDDEVVVTSKHEDKGGKVKHTARAKAPRRGVNDKKKGCVVATDDGDLVGEADKEQCSMQPDSQVTEDDANAGPPSSQHRSEENTEHHYAHADLEAIFSGGSTASSTSTQPPGGVQHSLEAMSQCLVKAVVATRKCASETVSTGEDELQGEDAAQERASCIEELRTLISSTITTPSVPLDRVSQLVQALAAGGSDGVESSARKVAMELLEARQALDILLPHTTPSALLMGDVVEKHEGPVDGAAQRAIIESRGASHVANSFDRHHQEAVLKCAEVLERYVENQTEEEQLKQYQAQFVEKARCLVSAQWQTVKKWANELGNLRSDITAASSALQAVDQSIEKVVMAQIGGERSIPPTVNIVSAVLNLARKPQHKDLLTNRTEAADLLETLESQRHDVVANLRLAEAMAHVVEAMAEHGIDSVTKEVSGLVKERDAACQKVVLRLRYAVSEAADKCKLLVDLHDARKQRASKVLKTRRSELKHQALPEEAQTLQACITELDEVFRMSELSIERAMERVKELFERVSGGVPKVLSMELRRLHDHKTASSTNGNFWQYLPPTPTSAPSSSSSTLFRGNGGGVLALNGRPRSVSAFDDDREGLGGARAWMQRVVKEDMMITDLDVDTRRPREMLL